MLFLKFYLVLKRCFKNYRHWFRNHTPIYIAHVSLKFLAETWREQTSLWFWKMTMIRKTWADDSQILSLCYLLKMLAFIFFPLMKLKSASWLLTLLYCSFSYDTSRVYLWNTSADTNFCSLGLNIRMLFICKRRPRCESSIYIYIH